MAIDSIVQEDQVSFLSNNAQKEVYVAIRVDDAIGSGTIEDPHNGRDDTFLDNLLLDATKITPRMTIRFGPGIFQTKGNGGASVGWIPKSGQLLVGAGMYQTTLQLVKAAPGAADANYVAPIGNDVNVSDLEISDMTIDAHLSRQPLIGGVTPAIRATELATTLRPVDVALFRK